MWFQDSGANLTVTRNCGESGCNDAVCSLLWILTWVHAVVSGDARLFLFLQGSFPYSPSGPCLVGVVAAAAVPLAAGTALHPSPSQ